MQTAISYVRVSTEKQGRSGLGIEAQRNAIARFADAEEFDLIDEFVEVETGKGSDALREAHSAQHLTLIDQSRHKRFCRLLLSRGGGAYILVAHCQ